MHAFQIELEDKPGELATVAQAIADKGINIIGFSGSTCGDTGRVLIMTDNESETWKVLISLCSIVRDQEIVRITLQPDPGTLAAAAKVLADGGVNIDAALPTGMDTNGVVVGFVTDDPSTTRRVLSAGGYTPV